MIAQKGTGRKSESSTQGQMSSPAENKMSWILQAEPVQSARANTTATLLFNIHILCILMLGGKSILPTNEKAVFVFTHSIHVVAARLPDRLPRAAAVGSNPGPPTGGCSGKRNV